MKNGNVNNFLDTLQYDDHYIIFEGEKFFFNAVCTDENGLSHFEIYKMTLDGEKSEVFWLVSCEDPNECVSKFTKERLFKGKTFWDVESEMTWVDA